MRIRRQYLEWRKARLTALWKHWDATVRIANARARFIPNGPPDLKTAFERYQGAMARVQEVSRTMPTDNAGAEAWYHDNADKLATLEKEVLAAFKGLKEAAAGHGLTNLDLGGE